MKKAMLLLGMISGSALTYLALNEDMQKMMCQKINMMKKSADKMIDKAIN